MAQIQINEISQNYTFNIGTSTFATVALPITASWGPAFVDPNSVGKTVDEVLEETVWQRFPATQAGLESFVSTFRGPAANYRSAKDYSYQMAMTLLTSGYDVLVCRLCPGTYAQGDSNKFTYNLLTSKPSDWGQSTSDYYQEVLIQDYKLLETKPQDWDTNYTKYYVKTSGYVQLTSTKPEFATGTYYELTDVHTGNYEKVASGTEYAASKFYSRSPESSLTIKAKYPGTFGNSLMCVLKQVPTSRDEDGKVDKCYWNLITYVIDSSGVKTALENLIFVFDIENSDDSILHISEVESNFLTFSVDGTIKDTEEYKSIESVVYLTGGTDRSDAGDAVALAKKRYGVDSCKYIEALTEAVKDEASKPTLYYKEWLYTYAISVYDLLKDKLTYNPNRVISPGWDDQDIVELGGELPGGRLDKVSPIHIKLMDVAYYSRCATGMIDIPKSLPRSGVYNEDTNTSVQGYAQMLARYVPSNAAMDVNGSLYHTHSALFAPWSQYTYVGTNKQNAASPSFLALLIQRAMLLNQPLQYEWALPTNRKHNLKIGKMDYTVPKKVLDEWQKLEGVGVNAITSLPDMGTTIWGNSTLYEVPPATYQALANLSTRYLVNAVEDIAYRCGISITFQYNNEQAYNKFYAGVTPTLDTMKNVGAIDDYYIRMAADINGLDQVNANTVIGKIYLVINGVVNDIFIDLIALPPGTDLNQFRS